MAMSNIYLTRAAVTAPFIDSCHHLGAADQAVNTLLTYYHLISC